MEVILIVDSHFFRQVAQISDLLLRAANQLLVENYSVVVKITFRILLCDMAMDKAQRSNFGVFTSNLTARVILGQVLGIFT